MQINVEAMFNQAARMSLKVSAVDMKTKEDRDNFEAGVTYWQGFQDRTIKERIALIKALGLEPKKRGRPRKVVVPLGTA